MFQSKNVTIHAVLNDSLSRATYRPQDLVPVFMEALKDTPEYSFIKLEFDRIHMDYAGQDTMWESDAMSFFISEELFEVLNYYAPEGYYFGSLDGDGSDFGFWAHDEN